MRSWELAPVIMMKSFREDVIAGAPVEVMATEDIVTNRGSVTGKWVLYILKKNDIDESFRSVLVKQRAAEPRIFTTPNGLVGIALELGVKEIKIPHTKGQSVIWSVDVSPDGDHVGEDDNSELSSSRSG
ncbi:MAG: hypothetical protein AAGF55_00525 [Pseudomonadota bacterium]